MFRLRSIYLQRFSWSPSTYRSPFTALSAPAALFLNPAAAPDSRSDFATQFAPLTPSSSRSNLFSGVNPNTHSRPLGRQTAAGSTAIFPQFSQSDVYFLWWMVIGLVFIQSFSALSEHSKCFYAASHMDATEEIWGSVSGHFGIRIEMNQSTFRLLEGLFYLLSHSRPPNYNRV